MKRAGSRDRFNSNRQILAAKEERAERRYARDLKRNGNASDVWAGDDGVNEPRTEGTTEADYLEKHDGIEA